MQNFLDYYDFGKPVLIEIDQINNLKDDKLLVLLCGNTSIKKKSINEKYIELDYIEADNIATVLKRLNKSFVYSESTNVDTISATLQAAKNNFFTTILVMLETVNCDSLIQDNKLVDFYVINH